MALFALVFDKGINWTRERTFASFWGQRRAVAVVIRPHLDRVYNGRVVAYLTSKQLKLFYLFREDIRPPKMQRISTRGNLISA